MAKKFLLGSVIALFILSLLPLSASAFSSELKAGSLIKAGNNSVYYFGADQKRYVFPNENTYKTWFISFNLVLSVSNELLGEIPIGGNVTYKPGVKLVKITTDPKVYYVDKEGTLRHISSESLAKELWGSTWYTLIDDVPDPFFINYKIGLPLEDPILPTVTETYSINQDKTLSTAADPAANELSAIKLSGSYDATLGKVKLSWGVTGMTAPNGFKIVQSTSPSPVYPGNEYHYLSDPASRSDIWTGLSAGNHYFRVCEYTGGACGIYSNEIIVGVSGSTATTGSKSITAQSVVLDNDVKIKWSANFTSASGFKIVKAEHSNPVYPGDEYHYLSSPSATVDPWYDLPAGTWHFRVCEYLGGKCGVYSNDLTVTISNSTTATNKTITAASVISGNDVKIKWTANFTSSQGFKIVKAEHINPIYPGDEYHYLSEPASTYDLWNDLAAGTYHFRVCEYLGGACGIYSNDLTLTVQ